MDLTDNPGGGAVMFGDMIPDGHYQGPPKVVNHTFNPALIKGSSSVPPEGGPVFPALEDVQISSVPT